MGGGVGLATRHFVLSWFLCVELDWLWVRCGWGLLWLGIAGRLFWRPNLYFPLLGSDRVVAVVVVSCLIPAVFLLLLASGRSCRFCCTFFLSFWMGVGKGGDGDRSVIWLYIHNAGVKGDDTDEEGFGRHDDEGGEAKRAAGAVVSGWMG